MSEDIIKVLMSRDGMTREEALQEVKDFKAEFNSLKNDPGTSLDDLEQCLEDWFGLEPDYLTEFLF